MSDQRGSSRRHGVWTHWVPLVLTVTVATVGIAAWAWSQRSDDDDEVPSRPNNGGGNNTASSYAQHQQGDQHLDYENADYGDNPPYGAANRSLDVKTGADAHSEGVSGWGTRMSGALRRTPSPQQFLDSAGKTVAAGVAAAGAAVGSALAAIREEDKNAYADHETWSEEADAKKKDKGSSSKHGSKKRKTVAIVVSADMRMDEVDEDGFHEHASLLSHIPKTVDFSKIKLFVLIYAPGLKEAGADSSGNLPPSLSSSFSNISHNQAQSPKDEKTPLQAATASSPAFNAIYSQALALVEKETMILPFTSSTGYSHILRHLQPDVVYLQESLSGEEGIVVSQMQAWLNKEIILVVGADSGSGGLADSESEVERPSKGVKKWWQREERVGRGRGVVVVDGMRVTDDWIRRVQGRE
ncbi:hypothetical protein PpBr36_06963 [Pyricularia pennisetigena]|uniref:hypothetical protein n=1 Tax=Pyricularia pennisetigena TaxID=1578925 RepID=UPI001153E225|nr:hypothetical protein PpBr36_06963 [Pyricularia pennisetigena]TLS25050.1 hypothetical protein PpBr36_06963 [Pyricularia pennisetigena]